MQESDICIYVIASEFNSKFVVYLRLLLAIMLKSTTSMGIDCRGDCAARNEKLSKTSEHGTAFFQQALLYGFEFQECKRI